LIDADDYAIDCRHYAMPPRAASARCRDARTARMLRARVMRDARAVYMPMRRAMQNITIYRFAYDAVCFFAPFY